ncbi:hypothetical protein [Pseudolabrys sp. Root1462]|uniref:hypothetical protein n=1 Tax=Pseudolabrys sp. Root1462 TaxID=1736466 RepID=UPI0012E3C64E|nr:hypothetical protein [Pseudolabrys sp. Root1462]
MTDALTLVVGTFMAVVAGAMAFTFGAAIVCRWLKWAPVNINVTINPSEEP